MLDQDYHFEVDEWTDFWRWSVHQLPTPPHGRIWTMDYANVLSVDGDGRPDRWTVQLMEGFGIRTIQISTWWTGVDNSTGGRKTCHPCTLLSFHTIVVQIEYPLVKAILKSFLSRPVSIYAHVGNAYFFKLLKIKYLNVPTRELGTRFRYLSNIKT